MKNDMYSIIKDGFLDITIGDWLHRVSEFYPDQDAVVNVDRGVRLSWKQLDRRACEVAKGLLALGVRRDDKVAIWATNYPEWLYLLFGCAKIGAVLVTVNTNYKVCLLYTSIAQLSPSVKREFHFFCLFYFGLRPPRRDTAEANPARRGVLP